MTALIDIEPSRIKIKGANSNIDRLRRMTSPLDRSLYEISLTEGYGPVIYLNPPKFYEATYRPKEPIPETFSNIIGNAVQDLRSALDYLAKRIGIARIPNFDAKKPFYFPAVPRKDLPAHPSLAPIEKAIPGFKELLLNEIRPENGPDEHLWSFAEMNNDAKHSDFIPVVTMAEIRNLNLRAGTFFMDNCTRGGDAASPMQIMRCAHPITIENHFQTAINVLFGEGTPFENEAVVPTLTQISQLVAKTVETIGKFVNRP